MLSSVVSFLALQLTPLPSPPVHAQRRAAPVRLADDKAEVEEYFNKWDRDNDGVLEVGWVGCVGCARSRVC